MTYPRDIRTNRQVDLPIYFVSQGCSNRQTYHGWDESQLTGATLLGLRINKDLAKLDL